MNDDQYFISVKDFISRIINNRCRNAKTYFINSGSSSLKAIGKWYSFEIGLVYYHIYASSLQKVVDKLELEIRTTMMYVAVITRSNEPGDFLSTEDRKEMLIRLCIK